MAKTIDQFRGEFSVLSNFYGASFTMVDPDNPVETLPRAGAEHHFQALKTLDPAERDYVYAQATPGRAKRAGQKVTLRDNWRNCMDLQAMFLVLTAKFAQPSNLEVLRSTDDAVLVEGNWWHDLHWGVCFCTRHNGAGENHLGRLLMQLRDQL